VATAIAATGAFPVAASASTDTVSALPTGTVGVQLDTVPNDPVTVDFAGPFSTVTLNDDGSEADLIWPNLSIEGLQPGLVTFVAPAPSGWTWTSIVCTDPDGGSTTDRTDGEAALDVDAGETVDCTYTLEPIAAPPAVPSCNNKAATIVAAPGATSIRGTQGNDVIVARSGNVKIDARGGDDTICTGAGNDDISGGAGNDWVDAGDGTNTVDSGAGHDVMFGGSGDDTLLSGMGNDDAFAGEGDNLVSLGAGDDEVVTGAGNDRISGGKDFDTCNPGAGQNGVRDCEVVLGSGQ
jgi:Ca2+-binding RTX toxin-like protein